MVPEFKGNIQLVIRATYNWLMESLWPWIQQEETIMRESSRLEEWVAFTVWWLTNTNCY